MNLLLLIYLVGSALVLLTLITAFVFVVFFEQDGNGKITRKTTDSFVSIEELLEVASGGLVAVLLSWIFFVILGVALVDKHYNNKKGFTIKGKRK